MIEIVIWIAPTDIEDLETYFCYLGHASNERDEKNESIFKVGYGKYSSLEITNLKLEQLLST